MKTIEINPNMIISFMEDPEIGFLNSIIINDEKLNIERKHMEFGVLIINNLRIDKTHEKAAVILKKLIASNAKIEDKIAATYQLGMNMGYQLSIDEIKDRWTRKKDLLFNTPDGITRLIAYYDRFKDDTDDKLYAFFEALIEASGDYGSEKKIKEEYNLEIE